MARIRDIENDMHKMALYWMCRKFQFLEEAIDEFELLIGGPPRLCEPTLEFQRGYNTMFTDWLLFERPLREGRTPFELYADCPPREVGAPAAERLRAMAATQFFGAFKILEKSVRAEEVLLEDFCTHEQYRVLCPAACSHEHWGPGLLSIRIAEVDGRWFDIAQLRMYDKAVYSEPAPCIPGFLHPEDADIADILQDAGYYLRLVRDLLGNGPVLPSDFRWLVSE